MNITRYTDYSLRVLIYLAADRHQLATISEIAERFAISRNHLMKVVQALSHDGLVYAQRGKNGGIALNREPEQINIGALVRRLEGVSGLVECLGDQSACVITPVCRLKGIFAEAMEQFFSVLDTYTLADLVTPEARPVLQQILHIES